MGVYLYTIRAEKVKAKLHGDWVDVHALKFLFKPLYRHDTFRNEVVPSQKMMWARAEKYWASRNIPRFVTVIYDGFEPDCSVIDWKGDYGWWDCDKYPGDVIGKLITVQDNSHKGFHWEVDPKYEKFEINPT